MKGEKMRKHKIKTKRLTIWRKNADCCLQKYGRGIRQITGARGSQKQLQHQESRI
jgi:hypothetical protein